MRSVTSYFNSTLYRKTMGRFWPLWTLYGLFWLFAMPLNMLNEYFDRYLSSDPVIRLLDMAKDVPFSLQIGVVLSLIGGVLCAMAAFGYLYNNRSACMIHALPMKRETLFTTQYLAGLSFLVLPHLVVAALTAAVELVLLPSMYWAPALSALGLWLLIQCGVALFFFSFAAFCAMFTGHILALPAFYGILNGLVLGIYELVVELMRQFFYGFAGNYSGNLLVAYCTPAAMLFEACDMEVGQETVNGLTSTTDVWYLNAPHIVAGYAVAGVVFALLALMVYRRRHVESAGDVVAIPLVRPVFKYGVSFCSGLSLGMFTAAFFGWAEDALLLSLCVLFWAAVGYFVAEMLLKKSFRVLRAWKGCLAMVAVLAVLCLSCWLDFFGVAARVPEPAQVASVDVWGLYHYPSDGGNNALNNITDPEHIQRITDLHRAITKDRARLHQGADDYTSFYVTYHLTDGSILERRYNSVPLFMDEVDQEDSITWCANQLIQDRDLVARRYEFDLLEQGRPIQGWLEGVYDRRDGQLTDHQLYMASSEDLTELWQAVQQDFDEGTIGVRYLFDYDEERRENTYRTDLSLVWNIPSQLSNGKTITRQETVTITLTPNARHTLEWLDEIGALDENYALAAHSGLTAGAVDAKPSAGPFPEAVEVIPSDGPKSEAFPAA